MTSSANKIDVAIIGGGIVGLWSAYSLLKRFPQLFVVVFESENYLGEHTSGRNSEVLHSGLYYPTQSLKHLCCLEGNQLWREYVKVKNLPFLNCGKVIAATDAQHDKLEGLFKRGVENKVVGMRRLEKNEIHSLKQSLNISDGVFISSSGVLNVSEGLSALRRDIETLGGVVLTNNKAKLLSHSAENFVLDVNGDMIVANTLVNAGGLFAVSFREALNLRGIENYYVKGSYLKLKKKLALDKLIYPIPPANGLGLGVHLTLDTAGEQKFGPDTEEVSELSYSLDESLIEKMSPAIHEIFKNINESDLQLGYAGVRPKVKKNGQLLTDFLLNTPKEHGIKGYFEFLGIESPGVTAAPSLAKLLCDSL